MRKAAFVVSCVIVGAWIYLLGDIVDGAARVEPGWSMAPVGFVLVTIAAVLLLATVWGVVAWGRLVARLWRDLRGPPGRVGQ